MEKDSVTSDAARMDAILGELWNNYSVAPSMYIVKIEHRPGVVAWLARLTSRITFNKINFLLNRGWRVRDPFFDVLLDGGMIKTR